MKVSTATRLSRFQSMLYATTLGMWREHGGRTAAAILTIALGVALGVTVHLINAGALSEMDSASRRLAGEADLIIRAPRSGFDESLYPYVSRLPAVAGANPAVEAEAAIVGRAETLKIVGLDALRAAQVQPALLDGVPALTTDLFEADAILLSAAAAAWLSVGVGSRIHVQVGTRTIRLRVIGLLAQDAYPQRIGLMDIAAAQTKLERLGRLNRIDVVLREGVDANRFRSELERTLPPGVQIATPDGEARRTASYTRAYRLNLDMLALIALFTGAFLVFSSQLLSVLRRRTHFALLRALGLTRRELAVLLLCEGVLIGIVGAAIGVVIGAIAASLVVGHFGADLGAGYFRSVTNEITLHAAPLIAYFALGVFFAVLGAALPALEASRRAPARALRAGDAEEAWSAARPAPLGLVLLAAGVLILPIPALDGIPVAGYASIALLLLGTVLLLPRVASFVFGRLPSPAIPAVNLAVAQLNAAPRLAAVSIAAVVISFSLMVSMLIMVYSFRASLEAWLEQVLPAQLYLRAARLGETGYLNSGEQAIIASTPGIARAEFLRGQQVLLAADRPPVTLIAREIGTSPATALPLLSETRAPEPGTPSVWISEAAADLHGWRPGDRIELPLGDRRRSFTISGIWRDYARQNGAIAIDRNLYIAMTGDTLANDAALWLEAGSAPDAVRAALRARLGSDSHVEIVSAPDIRAMSLAIFDRTFAVTYALEIAAIVIGVFGVSVSFSAQALSRRREFGMLRHIGMTRGGLMTMLFCEGALVASLGIACGLVLGSGISLILMHIVNRQSFHWSMDLNMPWAPLLALAALIAAAAAIAAAWSGRAAMGDDVVRAVREDW